MYLEHGDSTTNTMCFLKEKQAINDGKTIHHPQFLPLEVHIGYWVNLIILKYPQIPIVNRFPSIASPDSPESAKHSPEKQRKAVNMDLSEMRASETPIF